MSVEKLFKFAGSLAIATVLPVFSTGLLQYMGKDSLPEEFLARNAIEQTWRIVDPRGLAEVQRSDSTVLVERAFHLSEFGLESFSALAGYCQLGFCYLAFFGGLYLAYLSLFMPDSLFFKALGQAWTSKDHDQ